MIDSFNALFDFFEDVKELFNTSLNPIEVKKFEIDFSIFVDSNKLNSGLNLCFKFDDFKLL